MAFTALEAFPALEGSRRSLLSAVGNGEVATADAVRAIESDVALTMAVLREANAGRHSRGRVETIVDALAALRAPSVQALAERIPTFDFFAPAGTWKAVPEHFRAHALATQRAADRIACLVGHAKRDRLAVASLLHDIGQLVLWRSYPDHPLPIADAALTPQQRLQRERKTLGFDHAAVGGVLIGRWGLPGLLAKTIARHHDSEAAGEAAIIRLADMLAHHAHGASVGPREMLESARALGIGPEQLRSLMYESPNESSERSLPVDPCPLSAQEQRVLKSLAKGLIYKEIAVELGLSDSTIRSHLHGVYRKLDVRDRAQAVILATQRGWL